jgi:Fic family protein
MPKQISQTEYDELLEVISAFPGGALKDEIIEAMPEKLSRRTVLRRLNSLLKEQRLVRSGKGRATRYRNPVITETLVSHLVARDGVEDEHYIALSDQGAKIKQLIRRSLQDRTPVGYQRQFLESYRPNETWYLTEVQRQRLLEIGTVDKEMLLAGTYAHQILNRLLIDLSWNSSRLEGNTYSLLETEQLLELGQSAQNKDAAEAQMILNHKAAIELLVDPAAEIGFNSYTILNLHAVLADNLLGDPEAGGRLRRTVVEIDGTVFHPLATPQQIEECFNQVLEIATAIDDPFEQSFFVMVHLPYLQPFIDVNKRVSRLAANIPFIRNNLCPISFVDLPRSAYFDGILGAYELTRVELLRDVFIWAYERSVARYSAIRQSLGEPDPFRLRYRQEIAHLIQLIIRKPMNKTSAVEAIKSYAASNVESQHNNRFTEVTETELMSLHEGNIARYRVRPSEFQAWQKIWE